MHLEQVCSRFPSHLIEAHVFAPARHYHALENLLSKPPENLTKLILQGDTDHIERDFDLFRILIALAGKAGLHTSLALNTSSERVALTLSTASLLRMVDSVNLILPSPAQYEGPWNIKKIVGLVRRERPEIPIGVDRGVTAAKLRDLADIGISTAVLGSALFSASDPAAIAYQARAVINEGLGR